MHDRFLLRRAAVIGLLLAGFTQGAQAQQQLPAKTVKLDLTIDQAMLVVNTLGQIGCQKVADMATCDLARETLKSIQEQAKAQGN